MPHAWWRRGTDHGHSTQHTGTQTQHTAHITQHADTACNTQAQRHNTDTAHITQAHRHSAQYTGTVAVEGAGTQRTTGFAPSSRRTSRPGLRARRARRRLREKAPGPRPPECTRVGQTAYRGGRAAVGRALEHIFEDRQRRQGRREQGRDVGFQLFYSCSTVVLIGFTCPAITVVT